MYKKPQMFNYTNFVTNHKYRNRLLEKKKEREATNTTLGVDLNWRFSHIFYFGKKKNYEVIFSHSFLVSFTHYSIFYELQDQISKTNNTN